MVHLVCGFLGAGKTTFSRSLETRLGAVRFSLDEWYLRLFAAGPTYELDREALQRLLGALNDLWPSIAAQGVDVVLDFGFWRREQRDEARRLAQSVQIETRLYWLDCPDAVALQRCLQRNGAAGSFLVSEEGFFQMKARFEAPTADECAERVECGADGVRA